MSRTPDRDIRFRSLTASSVYQVHLSRSIARGIEVATWPSHAKNPLTFRQIHWPPGPHWNRWPRRSPMREGPFTLVDGSSGPAATLARCFRPTRYVSPFLQAESIRAIWVLATLLW